MGNYISCTLAPPPKAARVILPTEVRQFRQFRQPFKAAELMLESPNTFLVNSDSLHIGRRFSALSADEDLEFGNVYVMLPMKRLTSIVTAADMTILFVAANSAAKRKARILPEADRVVQNVDEAPARMILDGVEGLQVAEFRCRVVACRSRKPLLETIKEEPFFSR